MKLMPASRAAWMVLIHVAWSGSPQAPNIIAPRHRGLTCIPVRPRLRYSIARLSRTPAPTRQTVGGGFELQVTRVRWEVGGWEPPAAPLAGVGTPGGAGVNIHWYPTLPSLFCDDHVP